MAKVGGHVWQRGTMRGEGAYMAKGVCIARGHAWWGGSCVVGGLCGTGACMAGGVCAWQERRPLQLTVRILLECILVVTVFLPSVTVLLHIRTSPDGCNVQLWIVRTNTRF